MKGYGAKWRAGNPDKIKNKELRRYNLTIEDIDRIMEEQDNICALCNLPFGEGKLLSPVIDHDHSCCPTDKRNRNSCGKCIRGIIHYKCNLLLAFSDDDPDILQLGIEYLAKHYKPQKG